MLKIVVFVSMMVAFAVAHESIIFNGIVQDDSFEAHEKLNVEILETGEALQTTVGAPFSVVLPADTLWNICVTNSDTSGTEKEKCYELLYFGNDSTFSKTLGPNEVTIEDSISNGRAGANVSDAHASDSVILSEAQAESIYETRKLVSLVELGSKEQDLKKRA